MSVILPDMTLESTLCYHKDGREHEARARVTNGVCTRVTDGYVKRDKFLLTTTLTDRTLTLSFSAPLQLPALMAALAQTPPDEDENAVEFAARLAFRDELAGAFERAAESLRRSPRR